MTKGRRHLRGALLGASLGLLCALPLLAAYAHRTFGGWEGTLYHAELWYLEHLVPLTWASHDFTPKAWQATAPEQRHVLLSSLLSSRALEGKTPAEVQQLLGGRISADADRRIYRVARSDVQSLWWVLVVEFKNGHVASARRHMAWLHP